MALGAFVFNWQVLPRLGGRGVWREAEHGARLPARHPALSARGARRSCWSSATGSWMAAAIWGILALGDGMASLVGQGAGGPRLPWNARKGWAGFVAFVLFGAVGAAVLDGVDAAAAARRPGRSPLDPRPRASRSPSFCALVESLPTTLDDNLTVPLAGARASAAARTADAGALLSADPGLARRLALGLGVNARHRARSPVLARSIDVAGRALGGGHRHRDHGRPRPARPRGDGRVLRARHRGHEARLPPEGGARDRAGEGRRARLAQRLGQRRRAAAFLALWPALDPAPRRALLAIAYAASVATAAADTCSSEIGKAYGRRTFLITTLRPVPPGHRRRRQPRGNAGRPRRRGALVAAVGALAGLYGWARGAGGAGRASSAAWPRACIGTVAERRGWMGNDLLNALNTAIGAASPSRSRVVADAAPHRRAARAARTPAGLRRASRGRSRCCRRRSGVVSGAVTAWGAGHAEAARSPRRCCCPCSGAR